jgi:hypothetical protein
MKQELVLLVSLLTASERDSDKEHYTWGRFKRERADDETGPRSWWQHDKLWAGLLVACTLAMCWFFA